MKRDRQSKTRNYDQDATRTLIQNINGRKPGRPEPKPDENLKDNKVTMEQNDEQRK
jgi:hypothetical protein